MPGVEWKTVMYTMPCGSGNITAPEAAWEGRKCQNWLGKVKNDITVPEPLIGLICCHGNPIAEESLVLVSE